MLYNIVLAGYMLYNIVLAGYVLYSIRILDTLPLHILKLFACILAITIYRLFEGCMLCVIINSVVMLALLCLVSILNKTISNTKY